MMVAVAAPPHPHVQAENQDGIQDDVAHRADDRGQHTEVGEALCGDEYVHPHNCHDEQRPHDVDAHIAQGVGQGAVAGPEEAQHRLRDDLEHHGQHHGNENQGGEAVAHDVLRRLVVLLAHVNGGPGRAARPHQGGEGGNQHDDREAQPHAGEGQAAVLRHMTDVNAVHDVVEHIDKLGHHGGDSQLQQQFADVALPQIGALVGFRLCHDSRFLSLFWFYLGRRMLRISSKSPQM